MAALALLSCLAMAFSCNLAGNPWPIPQLTLPAGAAPAPIPTQLIKPEFAGLLTDDRSQIQTGPNIYSWGKGFNYAVGWDDLVRDVEGELLPLGYKPDNADEMVKAPSIPGVPDGTVARGWVSPDGHYLVGLFNVAFIKSRNSAAVDGGCADYVLGIDDEEILKKHPEAAAR